MPRRSYHAGEQAGEEHRLRRQEDDDAEHERVRAHRDGTHADTLPGRGSRKNRVCIGACTRRRGRRLRRRRRRCSPPIGRSSRIAGLAVARARVGLDPVRHAALAAPRRRGDALPPQFRHNNPLEIAWTVAPLLLVCALFVYTYRAEADVEALAARSRRDGRRRRLPLGLDVRLRRRPDASTAPPTRRRRWCCRWAQTTRIGSTSSDVTHSFWVPDFLFKTRRDPGAGPTSFDLRPDKAGHVHRPLRAVLRPQPRADELQRARRAAGRVRRAGAKRGAP